MKLADILGEQVNPLSNQHETRKRVMMMINAARKAYNRAGKGEPDVAQIVSFARKNANASNEELQAIKAFLA